MRLLLTRPEPDALRSAAALRKRGHTVVIAPLMRIEPVTAPGIRAGSWTAILATSANAALAIAACERRQSLLALPVFAVGERSAQAMRAAGFLHVMSAAGGVADLVRLVAARIPPGASLLHLAGEDRSGDLAGDLRAKGFAVETAVVYRAVPAEELPRTAAAALTDGIDGVLHYSRRSAEAYVSGARNSDMLARALGPVHFCLSAQVAEPLARAGAAMIRVAPRPDEAALFDLIGPNSHRDT